MSGDCLKQARVYAVHFFLVLFKDFLALFYNVAEEYVLLGLKGGSLELDEDCGVEIGPTELN